MSRPPEAPPENPCPTCGHFDADAYLRDVEFRGSGQVYRPRAAPTIDRPTAVHMLRILVRYDPSAAQSVARQTLPDEHWALEHDDSGGFLRNRAGDEIRATDR